MVACPQNGTSASGLKYRTSNSFSSARAVRNAVSEYPTSAATEQHLRGRHCCRVEHDAGRVAAGGVRAERGVTQDLHALRLVVRRTVGAGRHTGGMQLEALVATSQQVAATRSRLAKRASLADLLRRAEADDIEILVAYLAGELRQRRTGIGWTSLRDAPTSGSRSPAGH